MKKDIILAGVGGQGILTIASVIDNAALEKGLNIKQAEVHGMSQRGGAVQSHLRISDQPIYSDLIPRGKADLIISVEPMESMRYLSYLSPEGSIITSINVFNNISNYPEEKVLMDQLEAIPNCITADAADIACHAGNARTSNIVILGIASALTGIEPEILEHGIEKLFQNKGQKVVEVNLKAFRLGRKYYESQSILA